MLRSGTWIRIRTAPPPWSSSPPTPELSPSHISLHALLSLSPFTRAENRNLSPSPHSQPLSPLILLFAEKRGPGSGHSRLRSPPGIKTKGERTLLKASIDQDYSIILLLLVVLFPRPRPYNTYIHAYVLHKPLSLSHMASHRQMLIMHSRDLCMTASFVTETDFSRKSMILG